MNKKHSELEMFMRRFMNALGLGYQCYYKNRADNHHRHGADWHFFASKSLRQKGYVDDLEKAKGRWSIKIWDQRPGHYIKDRVNAEDSDCVFSVYGPQYDGVGADHKDDFLKWLLFKNDIFENFRKNVKNSGFSSRSELIIRNASAGNDLDGIFEEYDRMKRKYS